MNNYIVKFNKNFERYKNLNCLNICYDELSFICRDLDDKKFWK